MALADDLRAARALIDTPEKWCKGYPKSYHRVCVWVAANRASFAAGRSAEDNDPIIGALEAQIPPECLPTGDQADRRKLSYFNDASATTHADILALFDRAISTAETSNGQ